MRFLFIVLLSIGLNVTVYSQNIEWGVEAAPNVTVIYHISSYKLHGGFTQLSPLPGWLGGVFFRYHLKRNFIKSSLSYDNRNVHTGPLLLEDVSGSPIKDVRVWLSNNYLNWNLMYFLKFSKRLSLGFGLNNHFLLFSKTHFRSHLNVDQNSKMAPNYYMNYFYRPYWLSGLITFNIDFNRLNLWFTYDSAITSRLNKNSFYKEMENAIQVGMGFRFLNKKN